MISVTIPLKTTNPNNGSQGWSRNASYAKARRRKAQRLDAFDAVTRPLGQLPAAFGFRLLLRPVVATITRIAPSSGLDPHDGLGAALKGAIDGVADALGLKNDRDARVTWVLAQERGPYGVRIEIAPKEVSV